MVDKRFYSMLLAAVILALFVVAYVCDTLQQAEEQPGPGDTADTLAARVLVEEHRLYPAALAMLARGEVSFPAA